MLMYSHLYTKNFQSTFQIVWYCGFVCLHFNGDKSNSIGR